MIEINLLPWRFSTFKKRQALLFNIVIGLCCILFFTFVRVHYFYQEKLNLSNANIQSLRLQLSRFDDELQVANKIKLDHAIFKGAAELISNIQSNMDFLTHIVSKVGTACPKEINLTSVSQMNDHILFQGLSSGSAALVKLISHFNAPPFKQVQLSDIKNDIESNRYHFKLHVGFTPAILLNKDPVFNAA